MINGVLSEPVKLRATVNASAVSTDYNKLTNKPQINKTILEGEKTLEDIGVAEATAQEILDLFQEV